MTRTRSRPATRARRTVFLCIGVLALAACGARNKAPHATAAEGASPPPAQPAGSAVTTPVSADVESRIAAADPAQGKIQFIQCRACHSLVPESEPGKIGPTLYGVIGRRAGAVPGYSYSQAVASSGITWTADQVDKWLQHPSEFLPGNKMVFVGIRSPGDRANIIEYIRQESAKAPE